MKVTGTSGVAGIAQLVERRPVNTRFCSDDYSLRFRGSNLAQQNHSPIFRGSQEVFRGSHKVKLKYAPFNTHTSAPDSPCWLWSEETKLVFALKSYRGIGSLGGPERVGNILELAWVWVTETNLSIESVPKMFASDALIKVPVRTDPIRCVKVKTTASL